LLPDDLLAMQHNGSYGCPGAVRHGLRSVRKERSVRWSSRSPQLLPDDDLLLDAGSDRRCRCSGSRSRDSLLSDGLLPDDDSLVCSSRQHLLPDDLLQHPGPGSDAGRCHLGMLPED
jgi:hypothetical protein